MGRLSTPLRFAWMTIAVVIATATLMAIVATFLYAIFSWFSCLPTRPEIEVVPRESYRCDETCRHLRELKCPEGNPLRDGTSCTVWCEKVEAAGYPIGIGCILPARDCGDVRACAQPRRFGDTR